MKNLRSLLTFVALAIALQPACTYPQREKTRHSIRATTFKAIELKSAASGRSLRWPDRVVVVGPQTLLWLEGGQPYLFRHSDATAADIRSTDIGHLLDGRPAVAATRGFDGTIVVMDGSGRIAGHNPTSRHSWSFNAKLMAPSKAIATTGRLVYLLLEGSDPDAEAVVALSVTGSHVGDWGTAPPDALIQESLRGGGIAACPDGSVFFSYVNSPQIFRISSAATHDVNPVGRPPDEFRVLSEGEIRKASREAADLHSVAPLVRLGLSSSRVMGLLCSRDGILIRQVSEPGAGSHVEFWRASSGKFLGVLDVGKSVLLGDWASTLYLGRDNDDGNFVLERVAYEVATR